MGGGGVGGVQNSERNDIYINYLRPIVYQDGVKVPVKEKRESMEKNHQPPERDESAGRVYPNYAEGNDQERRRREVNGGGGTYGVGAGKYRLTCTGVKKKRDDKKTDSRKGGSPGDYIVTEKGGDFPTHKIKTGGITQGLRGDLE